MGTVEIDLSIKSPNDIVTGIIARAATPLVVSGMGGSAAYNVIEKEMNQDGYLGELKRRLEQLDRILGMATLMKPKEDSGK
jgi:hypothetical protein